MLAIETRDLTKDYAVGFWRPRPYRALDRLTLSVNPGEVFGFLGPNGAGKTTTLKLLNQLIHPTAGEARLFDRPVGDVAVRRRVGFLPESPYFYDHLTGEELLVYFARLFGASRAGARRRADTLLDRVGIGAERRLPLRKFSKGMLQRVGLAQALVNEPDLVFLDEPMSGLDPLGRMEVRRLILELRDRGCTVFFSSHILADAEALCSRVAILSQGHLVAAGRVEEMLAFEIRGWELVVSDLSPGAIGTLAPRGWGLRAISDGRYAIELPVGELPERALADVLGHGARLVSLNPVRQTLEEFFVQRVGGTVSPPGRGTRPDVTVAERG